MVVGKSIQRFTIIEFMVVGKAIISYTNIKFYVEKQISIDFPVGRVL